MIKSIRQTINHRLLFLKKKKKKDYYLFIFGLIRCEGQPDEPIESEKPTWCFD